MKEKVDVNWRIILEMESQKDSKETEKIWSRKGKNKVEKGIHESLKQRSHKTLDEATHQYTDLTILTSSSGYH
jgi:hypothetical protein